jgi:hypothetical protein
MAFARLNPISRAACDQRRPSPWYEPEDNRIARMSAEIINLRKARKLRSRQKHDAQAAANRVKFGRTKAETIKTQANAALERQRLDQLKRDTPGDDDGK